MPRKRPKPGSLAYKLKWLVFRYATRAVSEKNFKKELRDILNEFAWQGSLYQNVGVSLCKWLMNYKRYADNCGVDIKEVCKLANEVEPRVGKYLERWNKLTPK